MSFAARSHATIAESIAIPGDGVELVGDLVRPGDARGVVVFVHGSGSSRFSPRNKQVAAVLNEAGLATVLMDLLTPEEEVEDERNARLRFDIPMLARRVVAAVDRLSADERTGSLPLGCFGASTGAAAALIAAAQRPELVRAVVSRGGRPDLAGEQLSQVESPTLLIVGGADSVVLDLNRSALQRLRGVNRLEVVDGATHLFEEPGALDAVARLARDWFLRHLAPEM